MAEMFHSNSRSSRLDQVLGELLSQAPELQAAAVVSFDGLPMASALPHGMDEDRVAAMSAALLSLGERAAENFGRGSLSQVYVEGENGTVFLVSADDEAVLVAVGAKGAKVGLLMFEVRRSAAGVAAALRADDAAALAAEPSAANDDASQPQWAAPVGEPVREYVQYTEAAEPADSAEYAEPVESPESVESVEYAEYADYAAQAAEAPPTQYAEAGAGNVAPALHVVDSGSAYEPPEPYIYPVPSAETPAEPEPEYAPLAEDVPPPGPLSPWGYPMIAEQGRTKSDHGWTGYVTNGAPQPPTTKPQNGSQDSWS